MERRNPKSSQGSWLPLLFAQRSPSRIQRPCNCTAAGCKGVVASKRTSVTGRFQDIWKRQQGRCYYCGRPILPDQLRDVQKIDPNGPALPSNYAYVHEVCKANKLSISEVMGDVSVYTHRELLDAPQEIVTALGPEAREKLPGPIRENWPFMPLKRWFARKDAASITLTFKEIEEILGRKLSPSARKHTSRAGTPGLTRTLWQRRG